jgi:IS30 family transposase
MFFLEDADYEDIINNEELATITNGDVNIRRKAEKKAISKISHLLSRQFDTEAIFSETGQNRDVTIVEYTIYFTLYILFTRIAKEKVPDDRYEQYKEAREFFEMLATDKINSNLARKTTVLGNEESPAIRFGSELKLNNGY